jgi:DNA modification methylase
MAPEIALAECKDLPAGSLVLDPMVGSGTTLRVASQHDCPGIGFDLDPLAVLLSRVWTTAYDVDDIRTVGKALIAEGREQASPPILPWIDEDGETQAYVNYWFAEKQQNALRTLAAPLYEMSGSIADALRIVLSKVIVTKDAGASLARDASHSRPHKVSETNEFDVYAGFEHALERLCLVLEKEKPRARVRIRTGDARRMDLGHSTIDLIITSPPYLNAIDYLRGHRLSLVWMGYACAQIREIRSIEMGTERSHVGALPEEIEDLRGSLQGFDALPTRQQRLVDRYLCDLLLLYREQARVLRPGGRAVTVIGNSAVRGIFLRNDAAAIVAAERCGLQLESHYERPLPSGRRYLPPPDRGGDSLNLRMRTENVLKFSKN